MERRPELAAVRPAGMPRLADLPPLDPAAFDGGVPYAEEFATPMSPPETAAESTAATDLRAALGRLLDGLRPPGVRGDSPPAGTAPEPTTAARPPMSAEALLVALEGLSCSTGLMEPVHLRVTPAAAMALAAEVRGLRNALERCEEERETLFGALALIVDGRS